MQNKSLEAYMQMPYRTFVKADKCGQNPCFVAYHPELDGCMAQGDTWEEAINKLKSAKSEYIELYLELGWPVPLPQLEIEFPQRLVPDVQDSHTRFVVASNRETNRNLIMA
jgi:predicted RNase H-like HicB family nuclease